ncbi:MAG: helix-turn-helix transcriptional regulator [Nitrospiraceae bacterium]|nr:helix-turn-helix transcriptional regulator [Nitrospiraceae bacterium]
MTEVIKLGKKVRMRDQALTKAIAKRLTQLIGEDTLEPIARELDIKHNTLWSYTHAICMPSVEVLIKIAKYFGKTLDWLVLGAASEIPKDDRERGLLARVREAEELGVDLKPIEEYIMFLVDRKKGGAYKLSNDQVLRAAEPKPEKYASERRSAGNEGEEPVGGR